MQDFKIKFDPRILIGNQAVPKYTFFVKPEDVERSTEVSYLGTPVFTYLEFLAEGIEEEGATGNNTNSVNPDTALSNLRIDTVLITVEQSRNIVTTPIQGRNGTVKEFISDGDYVINAKGFLVYEDLYNPQNSPKELVKLFHRYMKVQQSIKVTSDFLSMFDITDVVVQRYMVEELMGYRNQVAFEVTMLSDVILDLSKLDAQS